MINLNESEFHNLIVESCDPANSNYDPELHQQLFALRPEWFDESKSWICPPKHTVPPPQNVPLNPKQ